MTLQDTLRAIASRIERIGDRYANVGDIDGEQSARRAAQEVLNCTTVEQALQLERDCILRASAGTYDTALAFAGEYDDEPDVDFDFISELEGGQQLDAYVPDSTGSRSGVTVATGVDLGQRNAQDIDNLDIPDDLKEKLEPYAGVTGQEAEDLLEDNPLTLSRAEADALDKAIKGPATEAVKEAYDGSTTGKQFTELPTEAQTVIASVSYQYGSLAIRTPTFWGHVTNQRWQDAVDELRNFGDSYPTRRNKEADLLQRAIDRGDL